MKPILTFIALFSWLISLNAQAFSLGGFGTMPVIDWSNLAESVTRFHQLKEHYEQNQQMIENTTGSRELGFLINSVYDVMLAVMPEHIVSEYGIASAQEHGLSGTTAHIYDLGNTNAATTLGQSRLSLEQSQTRFLELQKLIEKVNDSPQQKDILDLTARIGAEIAMLNNEMVKIQSLQQEHQAQERMREQMMLNELLKKSGELPTF